MQLGQTKVFLRAGQMAELDAKRAEMLSNAAKKIQRQVRTFLARRHLIAMRKAAVMIQKYWRGMNLLFNTMMSLTCSVNDECSYFMSKLCLNFLVSCSTGRLARKQYQKMRQEAAAICIQKNVQMWLARKKYVETKEAAIKIQSGYRGMAARKEHRFRRQTKAVIIMQVSEQQCVCLTNFI